MSRELSLLLFINRKQPAVIVVEAHQTPPYLTSPGERSFVQVLGE
ncbi:MAG: hypothetical protein ACR2IV_09690 [Bryobacteraceae bacterium]